MRIFFRVSTKHALHHCRCEWKLRSRFVCFSREHRQQETLQQRRRHRRRDREDRYLRQIPTTRRDGTGHAFAVVRATGIAQHVLKHVFVWQMCRPKSSHFRCAVHAPLRWAFVTDEKCWEWWVAQARTDLMYLQMGPCEANFSVTTYDTHTIGVLQVKHSYIAGVGGVVVCATSV